MPIRYLLCLVLCISCRADTISILWDAPDLTLTVNASNYQQGFYAPIQYQIARQFQILKPAWFVLSESIIAEASGQTCNAGGFCGSIAEAFTGYSEVTSISVPLGVSGNIAGIPPDPITPIVVAADASEEFFLHRGEYTLTQYLSAYAQGPGYVSLITDFSSKLVDPPEPVPEPVNVLLIVATVLIIWCVAKVVKQ